MCFHYIDYGRQFIIISILGISVVSVNLMGRNLFHIKYINWSYRIRGNVARVHINMYVISIILLLSISGLFIIPMVVLPRNIILIRALISKMLVYSAKNSSVNSVAEYSTLNPETNSDSLSVKSNGVRFVSANLLMSNIMKAGKSGIINQQYFCLSVIILRLSLLER